MGFNNVLSRFEENEIGYLDKRTRREQNKLKSELESSDRTIKALSGFSKSLSEQITHDAKERIKREVADAKALAHEQHLELIENEGIDNIPLEEKVEHTKNVSVLGATHQTFQAASKMVLDEGGTFDASKKISNLSGWALYAFTSEKAAIAGTNYAPWLEGEMNQNDTLKITLDGETFTPSKAKNIRQKNAAMKMLRKQYLIERGLIGINRNILAEENGFYDQALSAHANLMSKYHKDYAIEQSFKDKEAAIRRFRLTKDFSELFSSLSTLVDEKNQKLGFPGALKEGFEIIKGQIDINAFDEDDLEFLGEQVVTVDGRPRVIKSFWESRYNELEDHLIEASNKREKLKNKEKEANFLQAERLLIEDLRSIDPSKLTPTFLLERKQDLETKHPGFRSTKMENFIKFAAPDAKELAKQKVEIEKLVRYGLLTTDKLKEFDMRLFTDFQGVAKVITDSKDTTSKHIGYVEDMVKFTAREFTVNGLQHHSVEEMIDIQKGRYQKLFGDAVQANDPNPAQAAWDQIKLEWGDGRQWLNTDGTFKVNSQAGSVPKTKSRKAVEAELLRQNEIFKKYGLKALAVKGVFISKAELEKNLETFGTPGWKPPGVVLRIKKRFPERTELEILQILADANDVKVDLPISPAIEMIKETTTTSDKAVLNNGGSNGNSRVIGNAGQKKGSNNVELVPNGEGENVLKISEDTGIGFGEAAAGYDFLITNLDIAERFGFTEESLNSDQVDLNRLKFAISVLGSRLGTHLQTRVGEWGEHWKTVGKNILKVPKDTWTAIDDAADWAVKESTRQAEQRHRVLTGEFITEPVVDWTVEQLNNWIDSILSDIDDEQRMDFYRATWKYEPTEENLSFLVRPGFYGE